MPTPAYLIITGNTKQLITTGALSSESVGSTFQTAHENKILVQGFHHQVTMSCDQQSGQATGRRQHKPLVITKTVDKSSPLIYESLAKNEQLTQCTLELHRPASKGPGTEHYFTIELEDARIIDVTSSLPNCQDPANSYFTHTENVSFSYRKITWTHVVCSTSGVDNWDPSI